MGQNTMLLYCYIEDYFAIAMNSVRIVCCCNLANWMLYNAAGLSQLDKA